MKLKIHRGTRQIGGNIVEIATKTTRIILDCGKNLPALDGSLPSDEIQIEGLTHGKSRYDAVLITHHHADHCGLLERVNPDIPIYMSRETKQVLDIIANFIGSSAPRASQILQPGQEIVVGDIKIMPLEVGHSARGAMMFLVEGEGSKLLYTGDFNSIQQEYCNGIGNIDLLLCEGTNVEAQGCMTEQDIQREAARIMRETPRQVFVLCSTTNIDRILAMNGACRSSGRTMMIDPFMKAVLDQLAPEMSSDAAGFVPFFVDREQSLQIYKYLFHTGKSKRSSVDFAGATAIAKKEHLTFMVRQSMGGFMRRLNQLRPLFGSTLIYSMWRGYESTPGTKSFLDLCRSMGMRIEYLHTSGHAYREMLGTVIDRIKPHILVPIHTDSPELFLDMHNQVVLAKDGESLEIGTLLSRETSLMSADF